MRVARAEVGALRSLLKASLVWGSRFALKVGCYPFSPPTVFGEEVIPARFMGEVAWQGARPSDCLIVLDNPPSPRDERESESERVGRLPRWSAAECEVPPSSGAPSSLGRRGRRAGPSPPVAALSSERLPPRKMSWRSPPCSSQRRTSVETWRRTESTRS